VYIGWRVVGRLGGGVECVLADWQLRWCINCVVMASVMRGFACFEDSDVGLDACNLCVYLVGNIFSCIGSVQQGLRCLYASQVYFVCKQ
jgi:hypothetical protein